MQKNAVIIQFSLCSIPLFSLQQKHSFENELKAVTLQPAEVSGEYRISIDGKIIFDRKEYGGFPEIKELKQLVRDIVSPGKSLGHTDTKPHHQY